MALGIIVTLLASLRPAVRATRVPPIAAVREGSILPPSRFARFGPIVALVVCAVSLALILYSSFGSGLTTGNRLILLGVGVLGFFIGVAMVAPSVARPLASVLGRPAAADRRRLGQSRPVELDAKPGPHRVDRRRADDRARARDDRRRARAGDQGAVRGAPSAAEFHADYALTSQDGFTPTSIASAEALRKSGVATLVAGVRAGDGRVVGKSLPVAGVDPGISKVLKLNWQDGTNTDLDTLGMTGAILTKGYAKNHDLTRRLADPARDARRQVPEPARARDRRPAPRRLAARHGHRSRRRRSTPSTRTRRTSSRSSTRRAASRRRTRRS